MEEEMGVVDQGQNFDSIICPYCGKSIVLGNR